LLIYVPHIREHCLDLIPHLQQHALQYLVALQFFPLGFMLGDLGCYAGGLFTLCYRCVADAHINLIWGKAMEFCCLFANWLQRIESGECFSLTVYSH